MTLVIGILFLCTYIFAPLATSLPKQTDGVALLFVQFYLSEISPI